ncbi:CPBP family intramembrane metalloprotease [Halomicroarcula sp. S1AR25-4]|uniref:CPBP family intramembrane glutamic endopeptidase n=1 Tax=Haloarcula sp. S1AR25-4 TaxID=2950538 RepID=UPI0028750056|nr:CPBP family intramembrane glutamic endopeptidase [Halomicroarcula sp. S1AR25-4]MDS0279927.1 CPBP family intramembrane metalloprotease [Halomicroarcula sp. S1AR25-4]
MSHTATDPPSFERGSLVPVVTYLLTIAVLSGFLLVSSGESPSPLLGMVWGLFLVALAVGAFVVEGVSPRSLVPPLRSVAPVFALVAAFWALYNLLAFGLALGGVPGVTTTPSRVTAHPSLYLAALGSALLFTAIPEELVFRGYLQSKVGALAESRTRRSVATGIAVAAVLFALFHLPRWFLASGHGVGSALAVRLLGLTLMGLTYGLVYALTRNLLLVALFHATMNQPPFLLTVQFPAEFHLLVGLVEYAAMVALVVVAVRLGGSTELTVSRARHAPSSATDD